MSLGTSLVGRRIVVTRPAEDAARLASRLRDLGAVPLVLPSIKVEFTDPPELRGALREPLRYDWIVFTSKHGVEAAFRLVPRLVGPRIAAIGPATAQALRHYDVTLDAMPSEYVAEAIIPRLGDVAGTQILLPRADIARRALADGLRARRADVTEVAAYRTRVRTGPRPDLREVDAITFTSSSTVRGFLAGGPAPGTAKVVCIGPITAATARDHGLRVAEIATEYTEDGLIGALFKAFGREAS
jgi:uroporphyrinogen III methyltransferase/synthase